MKKTNESLSFVGLLSLKNTALLLEDVTVIPLSEFTIKPFPLWTDNVPSTVTRFSVGPFTPLRVKLLLVVKLPVSSSLNIFKAAPVVPI